MTSGRHVFERKFDGSDRSYIASLFKGIMVALGCNVDDDPNFIDTPIRWANSICDQFEPEKCKLTTFPHEDYSGLITLHKHESWTLCPHHFERVKLISTVSYIPRNGKVVGASKLARICNMFSKGCIMQETYTRMVADFIMNEFDPEGVAVHVEGFHNCMQCRGVRTSGSFITRELRGLYLHSPQTREEFLSDLAR
jgi:GTP cyclohydrolase I